MAELQLRIDLKAFSNKNIFGAGVMNTEVDWGVYSIANSCGIITLYKLSHKRLSSIKWLQTAQPAVNREHSVIMAR